MGLEVGDRQEHEGVWSHSSRGGIRDSPGLMSFPTRNSRTVSLGPQVRPLGKEGLLSQLSWEEGR